MELRGAQRHFLGVVLFLDAISAALLTYMLAEKLISGRMQDAHVQRVPIHLHGRPDPSWRQAVVGGLHFQATIQMHHPLSVLVVAEGFMAGFAGARRPQIDEEKIQAHVVKWFRSTVEVRECESAVRRQLLTSLQQFVASFRTIAAVSVPAL